MRALIGCIKKKEWLYIGICALFAMISIWTDMEIPDSMRNITYLLQTEGTSFDKIVSGGMRMLLFAVTGLVCTVVTTYLSVKAGTMIATRVRSTLFNKILSFSMPEMNRFSTSSLIMRCTEDITQIQSFVAVGMVLIFKAPATAVWGFIRISGVNPVWTMVSGGIFILTLAFLIVMTVIMRPFVGKIRRGMDSLNRVSREHIDGIKVIHAFRSYSLHKNGFEKTNKEVAQISGKITFGTALFGPYLDTMTNLLNILLYLAGAYVIVAAAGSAKKVLFADMVTFSSYALLVMTAFVQLLAVYMGMVQAIASMSRIGEVLATDPGIKDGEDLTDETEEGTLEFSHVSFKYPNAKEYVLKDINIRVEKGQTVAIVGATGSGKTSILNLIPRLYDVTDGCIKVNGKDVRDYRLRELRNKLGYIPQRSVLFSGTVFQNIAYGDDGSIGKTINEVIKAAETGQAREFIEKNEKGYDAWVAEEGRNYSGGQRQRLTISRAAARVPQIYLLDDSFSALDLKTDRLVRKSLRDNAKDASFVIVSQRIGTIMSADRIYVVDNGRIVGSGTHEELMKNCGIYKETALSQPVKGEDV